MKDPVLWTRFVNLFHTIINKHDDYVNKARLVLSSIDAGSNVLMFGTEGFPLDLYINYVATLKYSSFIKKECTYDKQVVYYETHFFIEIDFSHPSNRKTIDAVNTLILTIINNACIHSEYHLIICKNIEYIDDPYAFRVILERFNKNAKFLCTSNSLSKLETPLKSRFALVRIPLFSCEQIHDIMTTIGGRYHPSLSITNCRNIIKCIAVSDLEMNGNDVSLVATYTYPAINEFMQKKNNTIVSIRDFSFKVCAQGIPFHLLVQDLLLHIPETRKRAFLQESSRLEHRLSQTNGGRQPLYYEMLFYIAIYGKINTSIIK